MDHADVRGRALDRAARDWHVDLGAIRVDRTLELAGDVVLAMTVEEPGGHHRGVLVGYTREPDGEWRSTGGSSGRHRSGDDGPWSTWGGWGPADPAGAAAVVGGWATDPAVTTATLTDRTGRALHDRVKNGVVLFAWNGAFGAPHAALALFDGSGRPTYEGPLFPGP